MATFIVKFDCDNDAFQAPFLEIEIARILRAIANHVGEHKMINMFQTIFDKNGNDVGRFALKHLPPRE